MGGGYNNYTMIDFFRNHLNKRTDALNLFLIVAACIICSIYSIQLLVIVTSLFLAYRILSVVLTNRLNTSKFLIALSTLVGYVFLLQSFSILPFIVNKEFPLAIAPWLSLGFIAACAFFVRKAVFPGKNHPRRSSPLLNSGDVASIMVAALVLLAILVPPLVRSGGDFMWAGISSIAGNVDDSAHMAYVTDRIQRPHGLITNYPAGWHNATSLLAAAASPDKLIGSDSLWTYVALKLASFALLIICCVEAAVYIIAVLRQKTSKLGAVDVASIVGTGLLFSYLFFIDVFHLGFYSVFPELIGVVWVSVLLCELALTKTRSAVVCLASLSLLIGLGAALSWVLLLPPIALIIAYTILRSLTSVSATKKELVSTTLYLLPVALISLFSIIVQIYAMSSKGNGVPFFKTLLTDGAMVIYTPLFYLLLLGCLLGLLVFVGREKIKASFSPIIFMIAALVLFCGIIYVIQIVLAGKATYYFYKALYAPIVLLIPLGIAALTSLNTTVKKASAGQSVALLCTLWVVLAIFIPASPQGLVYVSGKRWLNESDAKNLTEIFNKDGQQKKPIFYYNPNNGVQADILMLLTVSTRKDAGCFLKVRDVVRFQQDNSGTVAPIVDAMAKDCKDGAELLTTPGEVLTANSYVEQAGIQKPLVIKTYEFGQL